MKTIILAAGMGTRLKNYTKNLPKGMLEFAGKSLIERQIETLRNAGANKIVIVKGFMPDTIAFPDVTYYVNEKYENTNMVETFMCAESEMTEGLLVCYSDILYEQSVIEKAIATECDIGVVYDANFAEYWTTRLEHPEEDNESFVIGSDGNISELGIPNPPNEKMDGRYVGILKFSRSGIENFRRIYNENRKKYFESDEPWLNSKSFKKAYMTDMLQAVIDAGITVTPIPISHGWLEFDTVEDYEKYHQWAEDGSMKQFFNIES